jgi:signal transduction histidine kinase
VVRDTTQQRLLQERIRRAEQNNLLGRIAAGVAHEVRNPLNAIQSITEALFQELGPKPEYELYSQHIRSQVSRLSRLMKDLLHLGKPVQAENLQLVSLPEVCLAAANLWREANPKEPREISFEAAPGSASLRVRVDATILQQALLNLIENAVQHSPPAEPIFFSLDSPEQRMIPVRVIDRGSGIPPPHLERVFDPFFTTRKGGTGLGLSLVKQSVEAMGGSVSLRNNEPPPGCTAEVRLSIYDPCYETNNSFGG